MNDDTKKQRPLLSLNGVGVYIGDTILFRAITRRWILATIAFDEEEGRYYAIDRETGAREDMDSDAQRAALHPLGHTCSAIWGLRQDIPWWIQVDPPTSMKRVAQLAERLYDDLREDKSPTLFHDGEEPDQVAWDGGWPVASPGLLAAPDRATPFSAIPTRWQEAYRRAAKDALLCAFFELKKSHGKRLTAMQIDSACEEFQGRWLRSQTFLQVGDPMKHAFSDLQQEQRERHRTAIRMAQEIILEMDNSSSQQNGKQESTEEIHMSPIW